MTTAHDLPAAPVTQALLGSIVRVRGSSEAVVASGFLVDRRHVLTCAHVINSVLRRDPRRRDPPDEQVHLDFPFAGSAAASAQVEHWVPIEPDGGGDLAVLRLGELPLTARPAVVLGAGDPAAYYLHNFSAFGFPKGAPAGVWTTGRLLRHQATGWVQFEDVKSTGISVGPGFSGAPVWDEQLGGVIGIVVARDRDEQTRTAYMMPTEVLVRYWPPLADLVESRRGRGRLSPRVPNPPPHYLHRQRELESLKKQVLADATPSGGRTVGVVGMAGSGKSVLVAALARDDEIRSAFPDGVYWIDASGADPKLTVQQVELAMALSEEQSERPLFAVREGQIPLKRLLANKAVLIVLDDVSKPDHLRAFPDLDPLSCVLFTTRYAGLARTVGAKLYRMGTLANADALELLADWAGQSAAELPAAARAIVSRCGNLPLALAMVGATVRAEADPWGSILNRLRRSELEKIQPEFLSERYRNLLGPIEASLDGLDELRRACFLDLAVFKDQGPVPEAVLALLWASRGVDREDTESLVSLFDGRSLGYRDTRGRLVLHNLHLDYAWLQASRQHQVQALHGRLLDGYARLCGPRWADGPRDGYFFEHLVHHLSEAGRRRELRELLLDFEWLQAKLEASGVGGLLEDFETYLGREPPAEGEDVAMVAEVLRLTAHVVGRDPNQLASQLIGRLDAETPWIQALVTKSRRWTRSSWLEPVSTSLQRPGGSLLMTLRSDFGPVTAIAADAVGRVAASGSADGAVQAWDLQSRARLANLQGRGQAAVALAFTADGHRLLAIDAACALGSWDLDEQGGEWLQSGATTSVAAVAVMTPDARWALVAQDGAIELWNLEGGTRHKERTLEGRAGAVTALAITRDGRRGASAARDGTVDVWDLTLGTSVSRRIRRQVVTTLAFSPDDHRLVLGYDDGVILVWQPDASDPDDRFDAHDEAVTVVAVSPDGTRFVSGAFDSRLRVWSVRDQREPLELTGHEGPVRAVALTLDGRRIVSGGDDSTVRIWDLAGREDQVRQRSDDAAPMVAALWTRAVAITPDARRAVSGGGDGTLRVWDPSSGAELFQQRGRTPIGAAAVTPDGRRAVLGLEDGTLQVFDLVNQETLSAFGREGTPSVSALAVASDGRRVLSGTEDGGLSLWDLDDLTEVRLPGHGDGNWVLAIAVSADGRQAASVGNDGSLKSWDLTSLEERLLRGPDDLAYDMSAAVTPDGHWVASGSADGTIGVWNSLSRRSLTLRGHETGRWVAAVALSPDGRHVVSGSVDDTVKLWDVRQAQAVATYTGDVAMVSCAAAWDDGISVITGDARGGVHVLRSHPPSEPAVSRQKR